MKNAFFAALALMMIAGIVAVAPSANAAAASAAVDRSDAIRVRGVIVDVHRGGILLAVRAHDRPVPIHVVDPTRIFLNGERAGLGDLQPRDHAVASVLRTDRGLVARAIHAFRRDG